MCCDQDDYQRDFHFSMMNHVIDKLANTITLFVTVPPPQRPAVTMAMDGSRPLQRSVCVLMLD